MSVTISIRFLTGRAHLHPWQTHHSEGRVEWPPSPWRLLRALVAVAGRGLTTLPHPDFIVDLGKRPKATKKDPDPVWPPAGYRPLPDDWHGQSSDEIPLSRLAELLSALSATPTIWLPKTGGGHTRQYFPIHEGGMVKPTGSAVFDTFTALHKKQPLCFHWRDLRLDERHHADLKLLLGRMTYFGRAESWCHADVHCCPPQEINPQEIDAIVPGLTHWECVCIEDHGRPPGKAYRDYLLERRLAPLRESQSVFDEALRLFSTLRKPKKLEATKLLGSVPQLGDSDWSEWKGRLDVVDGKLRASGYWSEGEIQQLCDGFTEGAEQKLIRDLLTNCMKPQLEFEAWKTTFGRSTPEIMLLRCLLRESGQDIKDGLERPIGTRWIHYAVPRAVFDIPRPKPHRRERAPVAVELVRYALNTATVHRPVLPPLTDTLLVAERFRNAAMALCRNPGRALSGHEEDGSPCKDHQHAFWWPLDEDNDGFIDHVMVWAPGGFEAREADALRRLTRLRQRGGRPDLLVTPTYVGCADGFSPWQVQSRSGALRIFASATPYFCPVHLTHGRGRGGAQRSVSRYIVQALQQQSLIDAPGDVDIQEIVFDYDPEVLAVTQQEPVAAKIHEPVPPRQFFPVIPAPEQHPPLPGRNGLRSRRYSGAWLKDPDAGFPLGSSIGLVVGDGTRFIRALSFTRRRRGTIAKGFGRIFQLTFTTPVPPRPFAIGDQCHFGLGLFVPEEQA